MAAKMGKTTKSNSGADGVVSAVKDFDFAAVKRTKLYKGIRKDLLDQLERNGTVGQYYMDLVDDYMDMWLTKQALVADIQDRGIQILGYSASGAPVIKKNESVESRIKINAQMLKLLSEIGIKPVQDSGDDDAL